MRKTRDDYDDVWPCYDSGYSIRSARSMSKRNKDEVLHTNPHYTEPEFKTPQTVFGAEQGGLEYVYSDRLWQWSPQKDEIASKAANESGHRQRTCNWYEVYLSSYYGKTIEILHIMAGVNVSNGYSYIVFGFREKR